MYIGKLLSPHFSPLSTGGGDSATPRAVRRRQCYGTGVRSTDGMDVLGPGTTGDRSYFSQTLCLARKINFARLMTQPTPE